MDGFERFVQGHLITLFSATNYCGTADNGGAILVLGRDLVVVPKLIHPLPPAFSSPETSPERHIEDTQSTLQSSRIDHLTIRLKVFGEGIYGCIIQATNTEQLVELLWMGSIDGCLQMTYLGGGSCCSENTIEIGLKFRAAKPVVWIDLKFKGWIEEHTYAVANPETGVLISVKRLNTESFQGHMEMVGEGKFILGDLLSYGKKEADR